MWKESYKESIKKVYLEYCRQRDEEQMEAVGQMIDVLIKYENPEMLLEDIDLAREIIQKAKDQKEQESCMVEQKEALDAYNTLMAYCTSRKSCKGCLLEMEENAPVVCVMEVQDIPAQ